LATIIASVGTRLIASGDRLARTPSQRIRPKPLRPAAAGFSRGVGGTGVVCLTEPIPPRFVIEAFHMATYPL
jgi:hypothetical protein